MGMTTHSDWTPEQQCLALGALEERKEKAKKEKKINNESLIAGSAMYYYCQICSILTDVLPETHTDPPKNYCNDCQAMLGAGFSEEKQKFVNWKMETCPACNGRGHRGRNYYTKRLVICRRCHGARHILVEDEETICISPRA